MFERFIEWLIEWLEEYWIVIVMFIFILIGLVSGGISIYCFIAYGNLPITEVPSWALPFMFNK